MLAPTCRNIALDVACTRDGRPKYLIAADAGMTPNLLSAFISRRQDPTLQQAARIANALGVPVESILPAELGGAS